MAMVLYPDISPIASAEAPVDCRLCPRLARYRDVHRAANPGWWNAPVPAFGDPDAWLAIVGLAPGRRGANRTGRPFTGDYSGDLLMAVLADCALARGQYRARRDDALRLDGAIILNAVKCLPPGNRPLPQERDNCNRYLAAAFDTLPNLRTIIALGRIAHVSVCRTAGLSGAHFSHGREHALPNGRLLIDSYHCSRLNINRAIVSREKIRQIFERALAC